LQLLLNAPAGAAVTGANGESLPTQATDGGVLVGGTQVPGLGWTTLTIGTADSSANVERPVKATANGGGATIENASVLVEIGADGAVTRIYDKTADRE